MYDDPTNILLETTFNIVYTSSLESMWSLKNKINFLVTYRVHIVKHAQLLLYEYPTFFLDSVYMIQQIPDHYRYFWGIYYILLWFQSAQYHILQTIEGYGFISCSLLVLNISVLRVKYLQAHSAKQK